jgi:DNA-directed RNA polymerase subunit RPC12/RpoP
MALIKCNECSKKISDQAVACPSCGAPVSKSAVKTEESQMKSKASKARWIAFILIVIGGIWFFQSRDYKEQSLPTLPIEVNVRGALLGSGKVLQIKNKSDGTLMVIVSMKNTTTKQVKNFRLDIPSGRASEIGHLEGWTVASGDLIEIRNDAYQTWKGSAQ